MHALENRTQRNYESLDGVAILCYTIVLTILPPLSLFVPDDLNHFGFKKRVLFVSKYRQDFARTGNFATKYFRFCASTIFSDSCRHILLTDATNAAQEQKWDKKTITRLLTKNFFL